jgi:DNA-binding beta-propeller fold protein YncE
MKQVFAHRRTVLIGTLVLVAIVALIAVFIRYRDLALSKLNVNLASPDSAAGLRLRMIGDVPLDGGASRFDYQSVDASRQRLFIAHLGAGQVTVFDLKNQRVITDIVDVASAHGVTVVPELGRVFAAAAGTHQVAVIDADSLRIMARADGGDYPDGLAYDPETHKLFVSDETGGADIVIDTRTNQRINRIDLGSDVGNTQYDSATQQILVTTHAPAQLVSIDPKREQVTARLDLPGCQAPHGFYVDAPSHRAFVSCEGNATLVVVDLNAARITATATVGDIPDVLAFDAGLQRLYVASESGVVAVFDTGGNSVNKIGQAFLAPNAHTVAVDPQTHRVYFPLENIDGRPVLRIFEPAPPPNP